MVLRGCWGCPGRRRRRRRPGLSPGGPRAAPVRAAACGQPGLRGGGAGSGRSDDTGPRQRGRSCRAAAGACSCWSRLRGSGRAGAEAAPGAPQNGRQCPRCVLEGMG